MFVDAWALFAESLGCYDPQWQALSAGIPVVDDVTAVAAAWLSWPGRDDFLRRVAEPRP